ncbi:hypothetical protein B0H11DRAFT_1933115 [Mycena galericulata]|nr:hypothetical protein B0H11DRAFT_1933115 [Mycena galericulata]
MSFGARTYYIKSTDPPAGTRFSSAIKCCKSAYSKFWARGLGPEGGAILNIIHEPDYCFVLRYEAFQQQIGVNLRIECTVGKRRPAHEVVPDSELLQKLDQFVPPWNAFLDRWNPLEPADFYDVVQWLKASSNLRPDLIDHWQGYLAESIVQIGKDDKWPVDYSDGALEKRWQEHLKREASFHGPPQEEVIQCWERCLRKASSSQEPSDITEGKYLAGKAIVLPLADAQRNVGVVRIHRVTSPCDAAFPPLLVGPVSPDTDLDCPDTDSEYSPNTAAAIVPLRPVMLPPFWRREGEIEGNSAGGFVEPHVALRNLSNSESVTGNPDTDSEFGKHPAAWSRTSENPYYLYEGFRPGDVRSGDAPHAATPMRLSRCGRHVDYCGVPCALPVLAEARIGRSVFCGAKEG